ncbi:hypothetical protein GALMADRAFT_213547 [Galerina marginata CBS 339.88]|uniref:Uncharacterized protein n=1 Tax=Galerina marginata (strain CBS 339.88) TaxID=685588 RepID=A0A067SMF3_GALM3|nr:hypothetical protein GALMADRAFT_213547 [Galerina marginata CBS 339.88]
MQVKGGSRRCGTEVALVRVRCRTWPRSRGKDDRHPICFRAIREERSRSSGEDINERVTGVKTIIYAPKASIKLRPRSTTLSALLFTFAVLQLTYSRNDHRLEVETTLRALGIFEGFCGSRTTFEDMAPNTLAYRRVIKEPMLFLYLKSIFEKYKEYT